MLALLATILVFVAAGPARRVPQASAPSLPQQADAGLQEFSFAQSKGGLVDWKIHARQAQLFEADAKAVLNDGHVTPMGAARVTMTHARDPRALHLTAQAFVDAPRV